ncbi:hypothetical protein Asi03nite_17540 [Actinoplanes siamensis]|uniref:Uncharacterized protein n=1 Tax=Actinoplanes siamensis TaxID=1223317 RepID=A0A919N4I4_9ACTN|nr:hypothetical protein Asi03nite_17540 [Actinoplanes siamensis]
MSPPSLPEPPPEPQAVSITAAAVAAATVRTIRDKSMSFSPFGTCNRFHETGYTIDTAKSRSELRYSRTGGVRPEDHAERVRPLSQEFAYIDGPGVKSQRCNEIDGIDPRDTSLLRS